MLFLPALILILRISGFAQGKNTTQVTTYALPAIYKQSEVFSMEIAGTSVPVVDYNQK